jgi:hypothetical protein
MLDGLAMAYTTLNVSLKTRTITLISNSQLYHYMFIEVNYSICWRSKKHHAKFGVTCEWITEVRTAAWVLVISSKRIIPFKLPLWHWKYRFLGWIDSPTLYIVALPNKDHSIAGSHCGNGGNGGFVQVESAKANGGNGGNGFCGANGGVGGTAIGSGSVAIGWNCAGSQNGGNGGIAINGGTASGASGSTNGNGNAGNGGIAIGVGSVADGTSGNGNGNGQGGGVAINGGHTHQGCTDAIGKMCFNPPWR